MLNVILNFLFHISQKQKDRDERKNNMKQFSDLQERKKILDAFMVCV